MVRTIKTEKALASSKSRASLAAAAAGPKQTIRKSGKAPRIATVEEAKARGYGKETPPAAAVAEKPAKKRRWRPGTQALREIRRQQNKSHLNHRTEFAIPRAAFRRLIREIVLESTIGSKTSLLDGARISEDALEMLQAGGEQELLDLIQDSMLNMVHGRRKTLMAIDLQRALSAHNRHAKDHIQYPLASYDGEGVAYEDPNGLMTTVAERAERGETADAKTEAKPPRKAPAKKLAPPVLTPVTKAEGGAAVAAAPTVIPVPPAAEEGETVDEHDF